MEDVNAAKAPALGIVVSEEDGAKVIAVTGDLDMATTDQLRDALMKARRDSEAPRLIIDLSGVDFIDSSGLAVLIAVSRTGVSVVLRGTSHAVQRAVEVTGLTDLFELET
jgi:anti-sigma B factor antagonist